MIAEVMRLYHNPRCSKSRQALNLLTERGIDFEDYRYLDRGIHPEDVSVLSKLNGIIRIGDLEKGLEVNFDDESVVANLIQQNPKILQRPILVANGIAVIGRPPENVLTLLL